MTSLQDWLFLRRAKAKFGASIVLEGRNNIHVGIGLTLADGVRIRSRCSSASIHLGVRVRLREFSEINAKRAPVVIGDDCFIAKGAWIGGCGAITIRSNVMIGLGSIIVSSDHDYMNIPTPYFDGSEVAKPITVASDVWIGSGCIVLGGSSIGAGSVVAAGSVVHGDFPENSLIVGVPGILKSTIQRSPARSSH